MKHYFLFGAIDLIILLVYPVAYIAYHAQKLMGAKPGHKNGLGRIY
jgi:hypothetical protein